MKQTAVEWLFQKLWDEPKNKLTWYAILKQAKQMEKEQIKKAHDDGDSWSGEKYYTETYGK